MERQLQGCLVTIVMLVCENTARDQIQLEFGLDLFIGICKSDSGSV